MSAAKHAFEASPPKPHRWYEQPDDRQQQEARPACHECHAGLCVSCGVHVDCGDLCLACLEHAMREETRIR